MTFCVELGLITPKTPGVLRLDTPAGLVEAYYTQEGAKVTSVCFHNVPAFVVARDVKMDHPELGPIRFDIAYGGNFYPIVERQKNFSDCSDNPPEDLRRMAQQHVAKPPSVIEVVHPDNPASKRAHHTMW